MYLFAALTVVAVFSSGNSQHESNFTCSDASLKSDRQDWLSAHNSIRSSLALGNVVDDNGDTLSPASNMYTMIYDCGLEEKAKAYVDGCPTADYTGSESSNLDKAAEGTFLSASISDWTDLIYYNTWDFTKAVYDPAKVGSLGPFINVRLGTSP
ncbi:unnamed protein product [Nippostrongylus brasiliensis]|uniref:SCP domain-containing protein n=1 Tax=Nippostrongylus brasiliensis TaxID=27835 RepID=A0A0N4XNK6_NIPBR|nr:unnamed protein product [Nippostrongylus brasiliensis]